MMISFGIMIAIGSILGAVGYGTKLPAFFPLILIGRFIMGLGVGPIKVCYQSLIKKWIKDVKFLRLCICVSCCVCVCI